jgi:thermitase
MLPHAGSTACQSPVRALRRDRSLERLFATVALVASTLFFIAQGTAHAEGTGKDKAGHSFALGHILVSPADPADTEFVNALSSHGGKSLGRLRGMNVHAVSVTEGSEEQVVAALRSNPHVGFAEVDRLVPPAAVYNDQYMTSEWHLAKINAPTAWDSSTGRNVTIAILDTGVDGTHPDLAAQMVPGWNFYDNNSNTADVVGHGTTVAGAAAAASNNTIGVASVAGGARLMPLRISDTSGNALYSTMAQAITWAADHGARVVNLSYADAPASSTVISAAQYLRSKGGVMVAAAGNSGTQDNTTPSSAIMIVSATDHSDLLATFSSYGAYVTISAPGIDILTTAVGGAYWNCWGTSLATPIVAGAAALVISARPDFTAAQIDSALTSSATDLGATGRDNFFGYGRVNAAAAVAKAIATTSADTTAPTVSIASPTGGTVAGNVAVTVNASDNVGVTRVDLRVNGVTVASDTASPYQFTWNSTTLPNGSVSLTAVAVDAAGNAGTSAPVSVLVSNATTDTTPPTVAITSPTSGTVSGSVPVSVTASDNVGVTRVDLRVNGTVIASSNVAPYAFTWNTTTVANGTVTLDAVAYDAAGHSTINAVSITVNNVVADTTPPTVSIASPTSGTVSGSVTVAINAADNVGVKRVDLRVNGAVVGTTSVSPYKVAWDSTSVANGTVTVDAVAYDAANNSRVAAPVSLTVSNLATPPASDTTPPAVVFTSPANGATVSGYVTVTTSASDASGAAGISQALYIDGALRARTTGASLNYRWGTQKIARGVHTLKVIAVDKAGNSSTVQIQVTR